MANHECSGPGINSGLAVLICADYGYSTDRFIPAALLLDFLADSK
jgi:hypothetical protein